MKNALVLVALLFSLPALSQMWEDYAMMADAWSMHPPSPSDVGDVPVLKFDFESGESQVGNDITINSITRTATCAYTAKDANPGADWPASVGETLNEIGGGSPVEELYGPFSDGTKSIKYAYGQNHHMSPSSTNCKLETEDWVTEFVVKVPSSATGLGLMNVVSKFPLGGGKGWGILAQAGTTSARLYFGARDGVPTTSFIVIGGVSLDTWNHVIVFWDRGTGLRTYVNGVQTSFNVGPAAVSGSVDNLLVNFTLAGIFVTSQFEGDLAFVKTWTGADDAWFPTTDQAPLAKERFYKAAGWFPSLYPALTDPNIDFSRTSSATFEMWSGELGPDETRVVTVGENWPRVGCKGENSLDVAGRICGGIIEEQRTNLVLDSEDFSAASWAPLNVSVSTDTQEAPDGLETADDIVPTVTTFSMYQLYTAPATGAGQLFSAGFYGKSGAWDFVTVRGYNSDDAVQFNLSDCSVVAQLGPNAHGTVSRLGDVGSWCRVALSGQTSSNFYIYFNESPIGDVPTCLADFLSCMSATPVDTVTPLASIWGAQAEIATVYGATTFQQSTYTKTSGSALTRAVEEPSIDAANGAYQNNDDNSFFVRFQAQPKFTIGAGRMESIFASVVQPAGLASWGRFGLNKNPPVFLEEGAAHVFIRDASATSAETGGSSAVPYGVPSEYLVTMEEGPQEFKIYMDGVLLDTVTGLGSVPASAGPPIEEIQLLNMDLYNDANTGVLVDEFSIYDKVVTP